jgi:hypothetical protein
LFAQLPGQAASVEPSRAAPDTDGNDVFEGAALTRPNDTPAETNAPTNAPAKTVSLNASLICFPPCFVRGLVIPGQCNRRVMRL